MWAAMVTRPDIVNAVREVAKCRGRPKVAYWRSVKCTFACLKCMYKRCIIFIFCTECEFSAYADTSYTGDCNGRRSVTGGVTTLFAGGVLSWMSKVQTVVALSSMESEYIALSNVAQELLFSEK
ncbi:unnamed protein product, partial [Choristocarpus tenellus]